MTGDATLLAVLVRSRVDNAVRYSPVGAVVQVAVSAAPTGARLRVEDSGPGIDAAGMARLGERFFRVLGNGESGSGLGWSISRRNAAVPGWQLQVGRSLALGGLSVIPAWLPPGTADVAG